MPKNKNIKKGASNQQETRDLVEKDDDHEYGLVSKILGGGNFSVKIENRETEVIGRLCGKMKHRKNKRLNQVSEGSIVLLGIRDFQDNKMDIVHVFNDSEVRLLRKKGALNFEEGRTRAKETEEEEFVFDEI
jgi:translation initiation factor 1A